MTKRTWVAAMWMLFAAAPAMEAAAQAPPAPVLVVPATGAALLQPITLQWEAIVDPDGPIGSYSWEISTGSTFSSVIASGFNNFDGELPLPTTAQVSGLANGIYFWRVMAAQDLGPSTGFINSPWSATGSFTVTGPGPAPGVPTITSPAPGARFHPFEFFDLVWTAVPGAHYYLLEADEDAGFAHPINLSGGPQIVFGTRFQAGWGNELAVHYRVRAVSADNVWGRPSATRTVQITNAAPVPPPPTPLSPIGGATISIPFTFDWTDTTNPQIVGYEIDIARNASFSDFVMAVGQISRSDYMVVQDPLVENRNHLPPGSYFWRVRALHGSAFGPWSSGASFAVTALPPPPPGLELFWILTDPGSVYGGNSTAARIALNMPAPSGGALVHVASDLPEVEVPGGTVTIPAGATDAVVAPVTSRPVNPGIVGTLRAAFGDRWEQNSLGVFPILWGGELSAENVVGGSTLSGTVTLLGPAPPGGLTVTLVSNTTALARPPASAFIPEGATSTSFPVTTSAVGVPTRVEFYFGSELEAYRAPGGATLVLTPAGSPAPPAAVSGLTLSPPSILGGDTGSGTVTLTAPAPPGGARIRLSGSMEGGVVVPGEVIVPAGSLSASFPLTPPAVARSQWVLIQASLWPLGQPHARTLRVDPGPPGPSALFTIGVRPNAVAGGNTLRGTVGLSVPAPPGGAIVSLASSNTAVAQVPASVTVAEGNSTASFTITTSPVSSGGASVSVTGTAGGASKTAFFQVTADPNAPLALVSISPGPSAVVGGTPIHTILFLNKEPPAGGAVVALTSSNPAAAQVPASVTVQPGLTFATFDITTSPVSADTPVTITGTLGTTRTAAIVVLAPPVSLSSLGLTPGSVVGGAPSTGTATFTAVAPPGGRVVGLSSSNPAVATVPVSVTVAAGATSATFPVTTAAVASSTSVTITGSAGGASRSATLTVTPDLAGFRGPTANAADSGGDGNGFQSGAANAHTDDAANAVDTNSGTASSTSCTSTARDRHRYFNYGLGVPAGASVLGIEVRLDARADGTNGAPRMCVQLSWDGGVTWTATRSTPTLTTSMATHVLGGAADPWGRPWTPAELSDASFRVRVVNVASSTARDFSLDWIAVRVTMTTHPAATTTTTTLPPATTTTAQPTTTTTLPPTTTTSSAPPTTTINPLPPTTVTTTTTAPSTTLPSDSVAIQRAEYDAGKRQLRVEATSTSSTATLTASVTATGAVIGTLSNTGGGRYRGELSWSVNPQNVTVRSSQGGVASRSVTVK